MMSPRQHTPTPMVRLRFVVGPHDLVEFAAYHYREFGDCQSSRRGRGVLDDWGRSDGGIATGEPGAGCAVDKVVTIRAVKEHPRSNRVLRSWWGPVFFAAAVVVAFTLLDSLSLPRYAAIPLYVFKAAVGLAACAYVTSEFILNRKARARQSRSSSGL